jgi:hypothetical protein
MRMIRNNRAFLLLCMLSLCCSVVLATDPPPSGYMDIQSVDIALKPGYADVNVTYSLDDAFRVLALMFGENDVKTRLLSALAFENATIERMDFESAQVKVYDIEPVYGDGLYWFPAHQFGSLIPELTVTSNQSCIKLNNVSRMQEGIVYY